MKRIAIIGTQGLPAKYGGFETLVENLVTGASTDHIEYVVFCSQRDYQDRPSHFKGTYLRYVPLFHANGIQSIPYDILSLLQAFKGFDTLLILGTSGCSFLPIFRILYKKRIVINIDGLEHKRAKWNGIAKRFLKFSEAMAIRYADQIVVDNQGIADYVQSEYGKASCLITYGADHVLRDISEEAQQETLHNYRLTKDEYSLAICRIEPENNCHLILEACATSKDPLVFIGNWKRSEYGSELKAKYHGTANIQCLDAIYDLNVLFALRKNCKWYLHGHSAGGTNPSLVEAMIMGTPIIAFDCVYNRYTTHEQAFYFSSSSQLNDALLAVYLERSHNGKSMREIACREYLWKSIIQKYEQTY